MAKKKVKMGWEVPFKDRRKPNVYYNEDYKFTLKRRLKRRCGKVYNYVELTGWLKKPVPLEDFDKESGDWFEMFEEESDVSLDMFIRLSTICDLKQLQYLVFSLMGYEPREIAQILMVKTIKEVDEMKLGLVEQLLLKQ
jgi:hypothetical protein